MASLYTLLKSIATRLSKFDMTSQDSFTSKSMASATTTAEFDALPELEPGTYLLNIHVVFDDNSNQTGRRTIALSTTSGGSAVSDLWVSRGAPVNGADTTLTLVGIARPTTNRIYHVVAGQNSGSAMTVSGMYQIYRLA